MNRRNAFFAAGVFAVFLGYFVWLYSDIVFAGTTFAKRDILRYYYPMWQHSVECWKSGSIPFWNPYHSFGKPFAANIQNCVFYPLQIILFLPDYTQAFNVYILVHLAMAGLFTTLWMRDWGASKLASFTAGAAFMLSGYMMSAINLTISLCSVTYFPLVLLCWRKAQSEKRLSWRIGLAVTLVFQYLAGDPSIIFSTLVLLTVLTAYKTLEKSLDARRFCWSPILRFAFSMMAFLGLAAFHYPLFYEFLKQSTRSVLNYGLATMWSVQFNDLIGLAVPFFSDISSFFMDYWVRQSWLENYYAGISVLILAFWAYRIRRDRASGCHWLLFLFGLSLALGRFSGVYWFFNKFFPFFGLIRYPVRFFYISYFALACLAGLAVDAVMRKASPKPTPASMARSWAVILAGVVLIWVGIVWAVPLRQQTCVWMAHWLATLDRSGWTIPMIEDMAVPVFENIHRSFFLAVSTFLGIALYRTGLVRGVLVAGFFSAVLVADVGIANNYEFRIDRKYMTEIGSHLRIIKKDPGLFRIFAAPTIRELQKKSFDGEDIESMHRTLIQSLTPNLLLSHRIYDIVGYDSLFLDHVDYVSEARVFVRHPETSRFNHLLNAKYFVSLKGDLGAPLERLNVDREIYLYRDPLVLPRAFLVRRAVIEPDRKKIVDQLLSDSFDSRETLFFQKDPGVNLGPEGPDGDGSVSIDLYSPKRIEMTVNAPGPRWLFLSDAWYSAWRAFVDDKPVPILRADVAFRAVHVDAGTHRVVWKYDPILFKIGLLVSILTACGLAVASRRWANGH